jgi:hypothetical protein
MRKFFGHAGQLVLRLPVVAFLRLVHLRIALAVPVFSALVGQAGHCWATYMRSARLCLAGQLIW